MVNMEAEKIMGTNVKAEKIVVSNDTNIPEVSEKMKGLESKERFELLCESVENEVAIIAEKLIEEHQTYKEVMMVITNCFHSESKLDELVYSKVYQKMIEQATK